MSTTAKTRAGFLTALAALTLGSLGLTSIAAAQPTPQHATPEMTATYPHLF